ncbi:MCE family protein [Actinomadura viridis]|uniref:Phospholipid/cholesterol/gamma-HCH transport system substrate-binding protein n=1 Tax=Actinomadura viridis TaxID=58110 RepID=A0A931DHP5_9ACTN|nr:MCE family protein [Actinomadura viridis]MBG6091364.1 phospholipid/cholesterol/gamma-HCH transport system substrate-binding protein [Actinomadura viridis]
MINPTLSRRLQGVVFLLVPALLVWLAIAVYQKKFTDATMVTLRTGSVGNELHRHADVKVRGVVVGEVREITADGAGARLTLALKPETVRRIPANVTAQMLPTTLFGQRFVALMPPPLPSPERLTEGSVITEDRTANAVELQEVLNNTLPLLTAVQPAKLSATLTAMAQALEGRGHDLGQTLATLDGYLKRFNPDLPALNRNIHELVEFTHNYSDATPDILDALYDFTATSRTVVDQRRDLSELYSTVTAGAQDLTTFLRQNSGNMILLASHSRPSLEVLARYSPEFPCVFEMLTDFIPKMDRALGKGTGRPGLRVDVSVVPSKGRYVPGRDTPRYNAGGGPRCYPLPYDPAGGAAVRGQVAPAGQAAPVAIAPGALGLPNSPQENTLVNELVAPGMREVPQSLPDWSSVLVGPIFRGAKVNVK